MLIKKRELANADKKAICRSVLENLIKVSGFPTPGLQERLTWTAVRTAEGEVVGS